MVDIFTYDSFRLFVRDRIAEKKQETQAFSSRAVAMKLKCNPGFFHRILTGERNCSTEIALKLCRILGLANRERKYFLLLVSYNQAKGEDEREEYFSKLRKFQGSKIYHIGEKQYDYYKDWYTVALREILNAVPCYDISLETAKHLASIIEPPVKPADIQNSMEKLLEIGILEKSPVGRIRPVEKTITSGDKIPPFIVRKVLSQFFTLGTEALDRFAADERMCSTVSVSVSQVGYKKIVARLDECRKDILEIAREDQHSLEKVCHLNMQLFPLTKSLTGTKK